MSQTKAQLIDAVDGSIVTADIADDAVNADKLASNSVVSASIVDGSIVNADINASAAIAGSKIADFVTNNANNRVLTASGTANSLIGEDNLTFTGSILTVTNSSGAAELTLVTPNNTDGGVYFNDGSNAGALTYQHSDNSMRFRVNSTEKLRIDSSGQVGIGVSDPQRTIDAHVTDSGANYIHLTNAGTGTGDTNGVFIGLDSSEGALIWNQENTYVRFGTNDAERMRIDSSGRVMIATTSATGISSIGDDLIIGSIGDSTSRGLTFATTESGSIRWADAGDNAMGRIQYSNSTDHMTFHTSNATRLRIDSDGVKFGSDSAAANALNDYEEGTWTPNNSIGMPLTNTHTAQYVKIGNMCWVTLNVIFNSSPADTSQCGLIQGLPFTSANTSSGEQQLPYFFISEGGGTATRDEDEANTVYFVGANEARIDIFSLGGSAVQTRAFLAGRRMRMNFCYRTA